MIYTIRDLVGSADTVSGPDARGRWSRAIPLPFYGGSVRGAWAVLRCKAVAVRYPVSGELEQALQDTGGLRVDPPAVGYDEHLDPDAYRAYYGERPYAALKGSLRGDETDAEFDAAVNAQFPTKDE